MTATPLSRLRGKLANHSFDGVLIPHNDCYQGEYLAVRDEWLTYLAEFTGSAGFLIILKHKAALFVDGRYTIQAKEQVNTHDFEIQPLGTEKTWLAEALKDGALTITYDPWVFTPQEIEAWGKVGNNLTLTPMPHFIDEVWMGRPEHPKSKLFDHPLRFAGQSREEKIAAMQKTMHKAGVDLFILYPESWLWLLNVRGSDLIYTPFSQGFAVVSQDGVDLFLHQINQDVILPNTRIHAVDTIVEHLKKKTQLTLGYDPVQTPSILVDLFKHKKMFKDPTLFPRACKNKVEIEGMIEAHIQDGVAWVEAWHWLEKSLEDGNEVYELDVSQKWHERRSKQKDYHSLSFASVAGSGPHGAIIHYKPEKETNRRLQQGELLLLDSGGQYYGGTTDITRVIAIGTPTADMKRHYTLVLQGHIAIERTIFPKGTSGAQLDVLARAPLWQEKYDFPHGTGHGVGSFLSVHEGPHGISKLRHHPLHPGMIVSNEPGYYREGAYGIRIESLVYVKEVSEGWYGFEQLTMIPLDNRLIDKAMLTQEEIDWVNAYHKTVLKTLTPRLSQKLLEFLNDTTKPL